MEIIRTEQNSPNQSELQDHEAIIRRVTKKLLRFALASTDTKIILIVGHLRSGKSSLFECLTNSTGHSRDGLRPVTREYQIGRARLNGGIYLFVDTPGLNDPIISNYSILSEIARLLYLTKDSVVYAGVIYVHPISAQFSDETRRGLEFLEHFCGLDYAPSITFVTTMWDMQSQRGVRTCDKLVKELIADKWSCFMDRGAKLYHHGRRYKDKNLTLEVLDIEQDAPERQTIAREIIASIYPVSKDYPRPLIVQELGANKSLHDTTVGQFLGMACLDLMPATPRRIDNPQTDNGMDWMGALVNLLKIPIQTVHSFAMALWSFLELLRSRIFSVMGIQSIGISPYSLSSSKIEVLISLPGGLRFVVGYGRNGPFWRPWASRNNHGAGLQTSDDDVESDDEEDATEFINQSYLVDPQDADFGGIFDSVLSATVSDDTSQEPESTSSLGESCAVM